MDVEQPGAARMGANVRMMDQSISVMEMMRGHMDLAVDREKRM